MDASVIAALFEIIAPITLIVLVGFCLAKTSDIVDTARMSKLCMLVGTPCLVFSTLTTSGLATDTLLRVSIGAICVCFFAIAFAMALLRYLQLSPRTFLPALTMPNSGNLGLPLVLLAFGDTGLAMGVAFYFVISVFQYTVMPVVIAGQFSWTKVLKEPLIWAVLSALGVLFGGIPVPTVIANTTEILGGIMIPLMLILLGAAIARLRPGDLGKSITLAAVRLGIGLSAGIITILLLGTSGVASGTIFLMATMPSALVTYVLAERFDREADKIAGLVVTSTIINLCCLPLIIWTAIFVSELP